jgi:plasmid stabilization system protein ParE
VRRIIYDVEARFDVLEIVEFYEKVEGQQLADRFTSELEKFIEHIAERPESFVEVRSGLRRANLNRFPHHIIFQIVDTETIKILTIKHDRRNPDLGLDR